MPYPVLRSLLLVDVQDSKRNLVARKPLGIDYWRRRAAIAPVIDGVEDVLRKTFRAEVFDGEVGFLDHIMKECNGACVGIRIRQRECGASRVQRVRRSGKLPVICVREGGQGERVLQPTSVVTELIAQLGITTVPAVQYHYQAWRYSNLEDALAQARRDAASTTR